VVSLKLDQELQLTDVFGDFYHEALVHPAMAALGPRGLKVLVIGGGDGGVATVALRYPIKEIVQVEIDQMVIDASKRFLPGMAAGYRDERHTLILGDALRWVSDQVTSAAYALSFDLCVIDTTDSPLKSIWTQKFFQDLKKIMAPHGTVVQNVGSQGDWLRSHKMVHSSVFKSYHIISCNTPDYPSPYFLALMTDTLDPFSVDWSWWSNLSIPTIYYHPTLHAALFALPRETHIFYSDPDMEWNPYDADRVQALSKELKKATASGEL
jgi:spermidine synthase